MEKLKNIREGNRNSSKRVVKDTTPVYQAELNKVIDKVNEVIDVAETSYLTVSSLPSIIVDGAILLFNGTLWRGLLEGESSLPVGTPWPVEGYKNYIAIIYWNGTGVEVVQTIKNNVGIFTWNAQTQAQMGVLLPYLVKLNEVYIENSYFVPFDQNVLGIVNIHLGNPDVNNNFSDIHFDCFLPNGDFDGSLLQAIQQYTCNFKFYPPPVA